MIKTGDSDALAELINVLANDISCRLADRLLCDDDFIEDLGREIAENLFQQYRAAAKEARTHNRWWSRLFSP